MPIKLDPGEKKRRRAVYEHERYLKKQAARHQERGRRTDSGGPTSPEPAAPEMEPAPVPEPKAAPEPMPAPEEFVPPPRVPTDLSGFVTPEAIDAASKKDAMPDELAGTLADVLVDATAIVHDALADVTHYEPWRLTEREEHMWGLVFKGVVPYLPLKYAVLVIALIAVITSEGTKIAGYVRFSRDQAKAQRAIGGYAEPWSA